MERYVFSGSLTSGMHDMLLAIPGFKPLDILVSQIDRSGVKQALSWRKDGFCRWLFIDSGAFSVHTGKANVTADQYIEFLNEIDDGFDVCAQLDTIPGKFGEPKSKQDYIDSAAKSWDNFLYMRSKLKSPDKVMPVFHFGESFDVLKHMLSWRDENGEGLTYIGISPANDVSQKNKNEYLRNVAECIRQSDNPNVKTHLYGMTSIDALAKYPCYSADSISHRLISGYGKVLVPEFGVISVSKRTRTTKNKSGMSFIETADEYNLNKFKKYIESLGFTIEQVQDSVDVRTVVTMRSIQELIAGDKKYSDNNVTRVKKLFNI